MFVHSLCLLHAISPNQQDVYDNVGDCQIGTILQIGVGTGADAGGPVGTEELVVVEDGVRTDPKVREDRREELKV